MYPNISRTRVRIAAASIVAASVLAACGSSDSEEADGAPAAVSATTEAMADDMADDEMADDMADDMADEVALAEWQTITLTDNFNVTNAHYPVVFYVKVFNA